MIERLNGGIGRGVRWLTLAMVSIGAFNALARWAGRYLGVHLSSNTLIELQWYLFSLVFLLGAADALRRNDHVRVDVLYGRMDRRARGWVDLLGSALLLIPFCLLGIWSSWPFVRNSWAVLEQSPDPGGLWRYPLKAVVPIAFALLLLQGLTELRRNFRRVRGLDDGTDGPDLDSGGPDPGGGGPGGHDSGGHDPGGHDPGGHDPGGPDPGGDGLEPSGDEVHA